MPNTPHRESIVSSFYVRIWGFGFVSDFDIRILDLPHRDAYDRPGPPRTTSPPLRTSARRPRKTGYAHLSPAIQNKGRQPHHPPPAPTGPTFGFLSDWPLHGVEVTLTRGLEIVTNGATIPAGPLSHSRPPGAMMASGLVQAG